MRSLKICFSVFLHAIVLANYMKYASSLLWDCMGAGVLIGDRSLKEQSAPYCKYALFHEKVVMLIQTG